MAQLTIQQAFDLALQQHSAGRLHEAERLYQQILRLQPAHPGATHYLGVMAHQQGRNDEAVNLIRRSVALSPDSPEAHNNLGSALRSLGRLDEAIAAFGKGIALRPNYAKALDNLGSALQAKGQFQEAVAAHRKAIGLRTDFAEAHRNLGDALGNQGALEEAICSYRSAIALRADFPEAHTNLGNALREQGKLEEAIAAHRQAIALRANFPEAHSNLGNALRDQGQLEEAIAAYREAIAVRPNFAEAYSNLGMALRDHGWLNEAIAAFTKAIELRPDWALPCLNLGNLFRELGQFNEACVAFQQAAQSEPKNSIAQARLAGTLADLQRFDEATIALDRAAALEPDSASTHEARGMILWRRGRGDEAVNSFRRFVEIAPESVVGWNNLGEVLRQIGRFADAADCFRQALARRPGAIQAYTLMASLGATDMAELPRLEAFFNAPRTPIRARAAIGFVIGKMLDHAERFDEAFAYYAQVNSLVLQMRNAAGEQYDNDLFARRVDQSIAFFSPAFFSRTQGWGEGSELPVFIVGMPRSGTTLVEQIVSSHPDVFGAGELLDMGNISTSMTSAKWLPDPIKDIAAKQLARLKDLGGSALRVIDKMPANVELLGLIATLFPSARVIICNRDPRDTCLSCFFQPFNNGHLFSFDLAQCGRHHVQIDRLIAHWLKVLPLQMLQVQYEEVVSDLEGQSRRLIRFLGLPWSPACIDFHRTERTVQTASDWQVRQPIYTRSVARWRNYERHLAALFEALNNHDYYRRSHCPPHAGP